MFPFIDTISSISHCSNSNLIRTMTTVFPWDIATAGRSFAKCWISPTALAYLSSPVFRLAVVSMLSHTPRTKETKFLSFVQIPMPPHTYSCKRWQVRCFVFESICTQWSNEHIFPLISLQKVSLEKYSFAPPTERPLHIVFCSSCQEVQG